MLERFKRGGSKSIDGVRRSGQPEVQNAALLDVDALPWEEPAQSEAEEEQAAVRQREADRRQRKIIAYFEGDDGQEWLAEHDVDVSPRQKADFLKRLATGAITEQDEQEMLLKIPTPFDHEKIGAQKIFQMIKADPRQRQVLAVLAGYNAKTWQQMDAEALEIVTKAPVAGKPDYRTPIGFASFRKKFLEAIRPKADERILSSYIKAIAKMEQILYGRRLEYYRQFEALQQEAREGTAVATERLRSGVYRVDPERQAALLAKAVIVGDAWRQNGQEHRLTTYHLVEAGLAPTYEVKVDNQMIYLSDLFRLPAGYAAVIAYLECPEGVKVRSYYRSQSQGMWRYLPDYVRDLEGQGGASLYGKGYGAQSVTLPIKLQEILARIEDVRGVKTVRTSDPNFLFAGTAAAYDSRAEYSEAMAAGRLRGDFYREVAREPLNHDPHGGTGRKTAPQTLGMSLDESPNFDDPMAKFKTATKLAGRVAAEGFASRDTQYNWLFCQDGRGRVWISQVETTAPVTSTGVRRDFADVGDFATPLYEYSRQTSGYGDSNDTKGPYQCMWEHYLSKVPLIQQYLQWKKR